MYIECICVFVKDSYVLFYVFFSGSRLQRVTTPASWVTHTGMPAQNDATILKHLVFNSHSTPFIPWCNML